MSNNPNNPVELSRDEKVLLVERKAACPFIGSAVAQGQLPVRNIAHNPLASIEDVRRIGNTGGGDLGDLLALFANGNHAFMRGSSGNLDLHVPPGLFSLDFPGSQGSHPGHSGILQGNPEALDSGRLSESDFARLIGREKEGWIKRSDVGRFIAENLIRDPKSKVSGIKIAELLASDFLKLVKHVSVAFLKKIFGSVEEAHAAHRDVLEKFTKLTGEDNLVGSAGEFGLLFAFLVNKPGSRKVGAEPAVEVQDLKAMFVDKQLPIGWEAWKKTKRDWGKNTFALIKIAWKEYQALNKTH